MYGYVQLIVIQYTLFIINAYDYLICSASASVQCRAFQHWERESRVSSLDVVEEGLEALYACILGRRF